jgi:site-specific DNA recombinase
MFTTTDVPRRVAIYVRVSTTEQQVEGYSLEAQRQRLLSYVQDNIGLNLYTKHEWIFTDTHTGSDINREGLMKMMEGVRKDQYDVVLVLKIDRLSRSLKHLLIIFEELEKHGVSLISMQENLDFRGPMGKLVLQIFGSLAQFERELIKDRTMMGRLASAEMGNFTGTHIPFGYKAIKNSNGRGKKLALLESEQKWVEQIYQWYVYDHLGAGQIADKLKAAQVTKGEHKLDRFKHSPWSPKSVITVLSNPIYRGEFIANQKDELGHMLPEDKWTVVSVPACVPEVLYQQAQLIRASNTNVARKDIYLLSGKLIDMTLPKYNRFVGVRRHKGGISYRRKQIAVNGVYHPVFEIPGKQAEEFVWQELCKAIEDPESFVKQVMAYMGDEKSHIESIQGQLGDMRAKKLNLELATARIQQAFENGSYSEEKMNERIRIKQDELNTLTMAITSLEDELKVIGERDLDIRKLKEHAKAFNYQMDQANDDHKRNLIKLYVQQVRMYRVKTDVGWNINGVVDFRFNLDMTNPTTHQVRTSQSQAKGKKLSSNQNSDDSGAEERT